jgi:N-acetylneuraminic acid mutarotase
MASPRGQHAAVLLPNGQVLVIGGIDGRTPLATAERYDPAADRWVPAGRLMAARQQCTATLLPNGEVLVTGGYDGSGSVARSERYDPGSDRWVPAGEMAKGRVWHTATSLANGHVLVAGGLHIASGQTTYLVEAERYDPAADTWTPAGELSNGRSAHTATALPGGSVLVAGGQSGSTWLAVAERYDPAANRWAPAGTMARARSQHQAALLTSGQLLVAGGIETANGKTTYLSAVERYDPAAQAWIDKRPL